MAVGWYSSVPLIRTGMMSSTVGVSPAIEPTFDAESGLLDFFCRFRCSQWLVDARGWLLVGTPVFLS